MGTNQGVKTLPGAFGTRQGSLLHDEWGDSTHLAASRIARHCRVGFPPRTASGRQEHWGGRGRTAQAGRQQLTSPLPLPLRVVPPTLPPTQGHFIWPAMLHYECSLLKVGCCIAATPIPAGAKPQPSCFIRHLQPLPLLGGSMLWSFCWKAQLETRHVAKCAH